MLTEPLLLLDDSAIQSRLHHTIVLDVIEQVGSTNDYWTNCMGDDQIRVCIAETQTQARGRFKRQWHAPFGQNIYLSIRYPFATNIGELAGLSLVVALAACRAINSVTTLTQPLQIKWPNDVIVNGQKLAGNLIEFQGQSNEFCHAIIGIGINVNMQQASTTAIDQPWSSLRRLTGQYQDRNPLCAALINYVLDYLVLFSHAGFSVFMDEWKQKDCLLGQSVQLLSNHTQFTGVGHGINSQGHLLLSLSNGERCAFSSGDTTLLS